MKKKVLGIIGAAVSVCLIIGIFVACSEQKDSDSPSTAGNSKATVATDGSTSMEKVIGYASLASVGDTVKAIKVEGVTPTNETIQNGTYKIQRNFVFVTRKEDKLSDAAQAFFDYAANGSADELITKAGAVPVKR